MAQLNALHTGDTHFMQNAFEEEDGYSYVSQPQLANHNGVSVCDSDSDSEWSAGELESEDDVPLSRLFSSDPNMDLVGLNTPF